MRQYGEVDLIVWFGIRFELTGKAKRLAPDVCRSLLLVKIFQQLKFAVG
jgi:hypothetical protein